MSQRMLAALLWRRGAAGLALGLALLVAACGPTGGGGSSPTPTVAPTKTPTPAPCTAWRIIPSPNATRYQQNTLAAVSALSPTQAWAVGSNYDSYAASGTGEALIEQWDGSAWRIVSSPSAGSLSGVAAVSSQDVWAVGGQSVEMGGSSTLIEHWNGTSWSVIPSPDMSVHFTSGLNSVVALAANDAWAVGSYGDPGASWPLIERWDGSAWHVVTTPNLTGALTAIARIPGTNHLWAVGYSVIGSGATSHWQALIEQWDGSVWKVITGPTLPSGAIGSELHSVVALSATDAWTVGSYETSDHSSYPLIAHWDGARWTIIPNITAAEQIRLTSIAAAGSQDVRVSGSRGTGTQLKPVVMRWNGVSWEITTVPTSLEGADVGISAMAVDSVGGYWAVGSFSTPGSAQTLIERCP